MLKSIKESEGYNSIRHSRLDYNFKDEDFFYNMPTVRVVRNIPDLSSYTGGDNFHVGPQKRPRDGYTLHNVVPEKNVFSFVLKHYIRCFPSCIHEWSRRHAVDLASDNYNRLSIYSEKPPLNLFLSNKNLIPSHVPEILRGLVGMNFYEVRPNLIESFKY